MHIFTCIGSRCYQQKLNIVGANDADVVILSVSIYHNLTTSQNCEYHLELATIWRYIAVHEIAESIVAMKLKALKVFHAFTGGK